MTTFKLLQSLCGDTPVQAEIIAENAPPAAPSTNTVTVDEANRITKNLGSDGNVKYSLYMTYVDASGAEVYYTAAATLSLDMTTEDNSFNHAFGNQTQIDYGSGENMGFQFGGIPHIQDNMDLLKMSPEVVAHVTELTKDKLASLDYEAIDALVGLEKLHDEMSRYSSGEPDDNY